MLRICIVTRSLVVMSLLVGAVTASAQNYPVRPLRIVTTAAGTGNDIIARALAGAISGPLGQPVVVDNRPAGVIPNEIVAKAPPDGYTMLYTGRGTWIGTLFQTMPYDPLRDFTPIIMVSEEASMLVVPPSLPVKSVKDLIALAKARPGELNFVATSTGGALHLAGELFKAMAGVNIVRVTYKGGPAAMVDLMSGQVHISISAIASVMPLVTAGKLNGLAVSSLKPSRLAPGLPTIAATLPGYEAVGSTAILGPGALPSPIVNRLNQEIARVLAQGETREKLMASGEDIISGPPGTLAEAMKSDMAKFSKLIKDAGIKPE